MDAALAARLGHGLAEVRARAVDTIAFKLRTGLVTAGELSREHLVVQRLIELLSDGGLEQQRPDILRIILQFADRQNARDKLVRFGALTVLKQMAGGQVSEEVASLAKEIVAAIRDGPKQPTTVRMGAGGGERESPALPHASVLSGVAANASYLNSNLNLNLNSNATRARSMSPHRPLPGRQRAPRGPPVHFRPPPFIPDAIRSFETVHLGPMDHETLDGFASLVSGPVTDTVVEEKLFDIICNDFGPQMFLQYPQLMRALLGGLDAPRVARVAQNLEYLLRIAAAWDAMFCAFLDSPGIAKAPTPSRTTPNISLGRASPWIAHEALAAVTPGQAISLPYASHEIFTKVASILRPNVFANAALRLLERLLPFIKIHAETSIWRTSRDIMPASPHELALFYLHLVASQLQFFEPEMLEVQASNANAAAAAAGNNLLPSTNAVNTDQLTLVLEQQTVMLALKAARAVGSLSANPHSLVQGALLLIINESDTTELVTELLARSFDECSISDALAFVEWITSIAPRPTIPELAIAGLLTRIQSEPAFQSTEAAASIAMCLFRCPLAILPNSAREIVSICFNTLLNGLAPKRLSSMALVLQTLALFDTSMVSRVAEYCQPAWTRSDACVYWIRAIFHRSESIRDLAARHLSKLTQSTSRFENTFVFPPAFLAKAGADSVTIDPMRSRMGAMELRQDLANIAASFVSMAGQTTGDHHNTDSNAPALNIVAPNTSAVASSLLSSDLPRQQQQEPQAQQPSTPLLHQPTKSTPVMQMRPGFADELFAFTRLNTAEAQLSFVQSGAIEDIMTVLGVATFQHLVANDLWRLVGALRALCENLPLARHRVRESYMDTILGLIEVGGNVPLASKLELARLCFAVVFSDLDDRNEMFSGAVVDDDGVADTLVDSRSMSRPSLLPLPQSVSDAFPVYGPANKIRVESAGQRGLSMTFCQRLWTFMHEYPCARPPTSTQRIPQSTIDKFVETNFMRLSQAASHRDFRSAMANLTFVASLDTSRRLVRRYKTWHAANRLLVTMPLSSDDRSLLCKVLEFVRTCDLGTDRSHAGAVKQQCDVFVMSIERVLLPLLQQHMSWSDAVLDGVAAATAGQVISTGLRSPTMESAASGGISAGELSDGTVDIVFAAEIAAFMRWAIDGMSASRLSRLVATTPCVAVLKDYTHHIFASETGKAKNHRERLNCLAILLRFVSLPTLTTAVDTDTVAGLTQLFVQVLGYSQHNYLNAAQGNAFTYKDRSVYRRVALCLRHLSRAVVVQPVDALPAAAAISVAGQQRESPLQYMQNPNMDTHPPHAWGDDWLFQDNLDWLQNLLHDEEISMQKIGLGILANIVLMRGSAPHHLAVTVPQFLDMAVAFVMDSDEHIGKRKEAISVVNNVAVVSWLESRLANGSDPSHVSQVVPMHEGQHRDHDPHQHVSSLHSTTMSHNGAAQGSNGAYASVSVAAAAGGYDHEYARDSVVSETWTDTTHSPCATVSELVNLFEGIGFFDHLESVLRGDGTMNAPYVAEVTHLLLTLSVIVPEYVLGKMMADGMVSATTAAASSSGGGVASVPAPSSPGPWAVLFELTALRPNVRQMAHVFYSHGVTGNGGRDGVSALEDQGVAAMTIGHGHDTKGGGDRGRKTNGVLGAAIWSSATVSSSTWRPRLPALESLVCARWNTTCLDLALASIRNVFNMIRVLTSKHDALRQHLIVHTSVLGVVSRVVVDVAELAGRELAHEMDVKRYVNADGRERDDNMDHDGVYDDADDDIEYDVDHANTETINILSDMDTRGASRWWRTLATVFTTMSDMLLDLSAMDSKGLVRLFTKMPAGAMMVRFAAMAVRPAGTRVVQPRGHHGRGHGGFAMDSRDVPRVRHARHAACVFLARLFSLHFGQVVQLDLETVFSMPLLPDEWVSRRHVSVLGQESPQRHGDRRDGGGHATRDTIGMSIYTSLIHMVLDDPSTLADPVLLESVRLALQGLLGRCEFAKTAAVAAKLPGRVVSRVRRVLSGMSASSTTNTAVNTNTNTHVKLDDSRQLELFVGVCLLRHLFAGSTHAKAAGTEHHVPRAIADILAMSRELREPLLIETLGCLRNLIANDDAAKRSVLSLSTTRRDSSGHGHHGSHGHAGTTPGNGGGLFDVILSTLGDEKRSISVFTAALEIFKLLVLEKSCRTYMFKSNVGSELAKMAETMAKQRDTVRAEAIVYFFVHATYTIDGQSTVMRLPEWMALLGGLLGSKSVALRRAVLILLRNLALSRENKAHLLSDHQLVQRLQRLLSSCKTLGLIAPAASLVWVLLYDSEKAKGIFKHMDFTRVVMDVDEQLRSDYAWVLVDRDVVMATPSPKLHGVSKHGTGLHRDKQVVVQGGAVPLNQQVTSSSSLRSPVSPPVKHGGNQPLSSQQVVTAVSDIKGVSHDDVELVTETLRNLSRISRILAA